jgi:hypothetical protein
MSKRSHLVHLQYGNNINHTQRLNNDPRLLTINLTLRAELYFLCPPTLQGILNKPNGEREEPHSKRIKKPMKMLNFSLLSESTSITLHTPTLKTAGLHLQGGSDDDDEDSSSFDSSADDSADRWDYGDDDDDGAGALEFGDNDAVIETDDGYTGDEDN